MGLYFYLVQFPKDLNRLKKITYDLPEIFVSQVCFLAVGVCLFLLFLLSWVIKEREREKEKEKKKRITSHFPLLTEENWSLQQIIQDEYQEERNKIYTSTIMVTCPVLNIASHP